MLSDAVSKQFPLMKKEIPFSFRRHTTVGLGGNAPIGVFPATAEELSAVVCFLEKEKIAYCVVGCGSNILVSDKGFDGVAVCTRLADAVRAEGNLIYAESGASTAKLLSVAAKNGLSGLEYLAGIPASVGGILYMNAGARGKYIGGSVFRVRVFAGGAEHVLSGRECGYSYKESRFMHERACILGGVFIAKKCSKSEVCDRIERSVGARRGLPGGKSLGCVFKNPTAVSAGELIERSGLKGERCGGAVVSCGHANFIINEGGATAEDYRKLILRVKERVFSETGTLLSEEIRYIGEFSDDSDG